MTNTTFSNITSLTRSFNRDTAYQLFYKKVCLSFYSFTLEPCSYFLCSLLFFSTLAFSSNTYFCSFFPVFNSHYPTIYFWSFLVHSVCQTRDQPYLLIFIFFLSCLYAYVENILLPCIRTCKESKPCNVFVGVHNNYE